MDKMNYYNVAVKAPLLKSLIYQSKENISKGQFITVSLGSRKLSGLVLSQTLKPDFEVKNIIAVDDQTPVLDEKRLQWIQWLSDYYFYSIGLTAHFCYPPKKPKKIKQNVPALRQSSDVFHLTLYQKKCVLNIQKTKGFKVHLLYGVTGSGKTEVYLQLIEDKIQNGQSALVLVPEISLTPQLFSRFNARFPGQVALLHSGIGSKQKYIEWKELFHGQKKILLGARSAVFCPLPRLSLIIVDEEHETHFKQDEKLKYHGRDVAIMLAKMYNIPIILGSATPSLETWSKALSGQYQCHTLKTRFKNYPMPKMKIIDLKKEKKRDFLPFWLSFSLFEAIEKSLRKKEQVALFINRRGQASISLCSFCGKNQKCVNCDISLILHFEKYLVCHYCHYSIEVQNSLCSFCGKKEFIHLGVGTQTVYSHIKKLFPKSNIQLADSDHIYTAKQFQNLVSNMLEKKIDILIGTQMIAKGLDFPGLNLVGFILADLALYGQDFRSTERCFQLLTQMAGRSGRHSLKPGNVIIQTYNPDHYAIQSVAHMAFREMADQELKYRKRLNYPPYSRLTLICISSIEKDIAQKEAQKVADMLKTMNQKNLQYLGPAPIFKLRSRYRCNILIKSFSSRIMQNVCHRLLSIKPAPKISIHLNRDPMFF